MENDSWLKNAKIYQILIDRFAGWQENYTDDELKKGFIGGNLKNLMTKLDYISSLGFNSIWLSPFFVNRGYHGYHVTNYNHVDPRFAFGKFIPIGNEDIGNPLMDNDDDYYTPSDRILIEFIEKSHEKGFKIIADYVPNHCHENHPFFLSAKNDINSKFRKWFYFNADNSYKRFLNINELPKFNLDYPKCREYMINVAKRWIRCGIDGLRIDHCIGPSLDFLKNLKTSIKNEHNEIVLIGECLPLINDYYDTILGIENIESLNIPPNNEIVKEHIYLFDRIFLTYDGILDSLLDFSYMLIIHMHAEGKLRDDELLKMIQEHYNNLKDSKLILCKFLDSHDSDRISFLCKNNKSLVDRYINLMKENKFNREDAYIWYYGTEDYMTHKNHINIEDYGDYQTRLPKKFT